jgi:uncharacterized protein DUF2652/polyketide cyclase/dehydrase/lipid transport protein
MASKGTFVISDISGYTAFLTQAELEHAEDILRHLITAMLDETRPPLIFAKLEGDAIFAYCPQGGFASGQTLVEMVETMYGAFRRTLENTRLNTTCTCNACRLIPTLDLKFVVHYGDYVEQRIGAVRELQGPEVITVHRLLKNSIRETTGVDAYAFYSQAAIDALALGELAESSLVKHQETYEHVGDVPGYVQDMHAVWERLQIEQTITVDRNRAMYVCERVVPVSPVVVWDYLSDPVRRQTWMGVDKISLQKLRGGRQGIGSEQHCAHDGRVARMVNVAWKPFDFLTQEVDLGMPGGIYYRFTINLTLTENGDTRVSEVNAPLIGTTALGKLLAKLLTPFMKGYFQGYSTRGYDKLKAMLSEARQIGALAEAHNQPPVEIPVVLVQEHSHG